MLKYTWPEVYLSHWRFPFSTNAVSTKPLRSSAGNRRRRQLENGHSKRKSAIIALIKQSRFDSPTWKATFSIKLGERKRREERGRKKRERKRKRGFRHQFHVIMSVPLCHFLIGRDSVRAHRQSIDFRNWPRRPSDINRPDIVSSAMNLDK